MYKKSLRITLSASERKELTATVTSLVTSLMTDEVAEHNRDFAVELADKFVNGAESWANDYKPESDFAFDELKNWAANYKLRSTGFDKADDVLTVAADYDPDADADAVASVSEAREYA